MRQDNKCGAMKKTYFKAWLELQATQILKTTGHPDTLLYEWYFELSLACQIKIVCTYVYTCLKKVLRQLKPVTLWLTSLV